MLSVFPTRNGVFQWNYISCLKTRIVLEGLEKDKDEFQLISWSPNSANLNLLVYSWAFVEKLLKHHISACLKTLTLRDHCLDEWYNLSPVIFQ
ncbi:DDE_3 domain-containing protein [Trichonephila clavipes]|nr:DDE_3 domain-containing protein [Trichonephila clavipes]